ncbi:60S ribosomal protein L19 [Cordyceps javanica]|uniref:60S ribosomal protein L19 n=1 Tax=Cordyceps javanica TaxID=43265 RepID=A0A545W153_9HYPO|nr:60S ribosomal protein L19 [Cordyceps javanica]TQW07711.1 60S ribosomal protein L19 [Cordyceps javanica]
MAAPVRPSDDGTLDADVTSPAVGHVGAFLDGSRSANDALPGGSPATRRRWSMTQLIDSTVQGTFSKASHFFQWLDTTPGRGVLKCAIAYTLASMATFVPFLSDFLGKPDGKHVVATITVYFHAARSTGSMIEAILIAIVAVAYAELVSLLSMATSVLVGSVFGLVRLAHALVVIVFIGGGFGFMGWTKQRMNNPLVNVASTLASLAIISVVTKETAVIDNVFSNQKIVQVFKMLIMGITCTAVVNLLLWRVSARQLLRASVTQSSVSLGSMLSDATASFLACADQDATPPNFPDSDAYSKAHSLMLKHLREAKFEHYLLGHARVYSLERATVMSIETLAQSIGALRSAAKAQFALLNGDGRDAILFQIHSTSATPYVARDIDPFSFLGTESSQTTEAGSRDAPDLRAAGRLFADFAHALRHPMQNLSGILCQVLTQMPFAGAPDYSIQTNDALREELTKRLEIFGNARTDALQGLYCRIRQENDSGRPQIVLEEVAAACGHFSFTLQSFGEEMKTYLDVLEDLKHSYDRKECSWRWLLWWRRNKPDHGLAALPFDVPESEVLVKPIRKSAVPTGIPRSMRDRRDTYGWDAAPNASRILSKLSQALLHFLRRMASDDVLFGLKVGIGAALWGMLAFIEATRDMYNHYRGEWGLLSFMIVCSMTVGASNTTGWARFMGTFAGAFFSLFNWTVSQGNGVLLAILGSFVAFFNFYLIVACGRAPLGRMTILAYNVSTLYAYSLSQKVDDNDEDEGGIHPIMRDIVMHRVISVCTGILWGLAVCRFVWPISARLKFREGISVLFLQMGLIWRRGPLAILLRSDCSRSYLKSGEQVALQRYADRLESLRHSAASEFELRGPFPFEANGRILRSINRILDGFYSMSLVAQRKAGLSVGERALLEFTAPERAVLCDRICHIFQVLASSTMLEYPLTDAIPSIARARDRLLSKIFEFREVHAARRQAALGIGSPSGQQQGPEWSGPGVGLDVAVNERDYALLYAYALVTGQVEDELKITRQEIEGLLGVLKDDPLLTE